MTLRLLVILAMAVTLSAHASTPLSLFGVTLKDAERKTLRQAVKQAGLGADREDDRYWYDVYNAKSALQGADRLAIGYEAESQRFAIASYTFPAFVDPAKVREVIELVRRKYGPPTKITGRYEVGRVTATWELGENMGIEVSRGWPDTTVQLHYVDYSRHGRLKNEMRAEDEKEQRKLEKKQDRAY